MTDSEIIKALECCCVSECDECPYDEQTACVEILKEGTLALINRQQAELERLKGIAEVKQKNKRTLKSETIKEFAERLKGDLNKDFRLYGNCTVYDWVKHIDRIVTETVGAE